MVTAADVVVIAVFVAAAGSRNILSHFSIHL